NARAHQVHSATIGRLAPSQRYGSSTLSCVDAIGVENIGKSYLIALWCSSGEVAARQSVSVMTWNPCSDAVRMVDSTQQLVRNPPRITVWIPLLRRMKSRLVLANASSPRLPSTTISPSMGASASTMAAPHEPLTNALPSTTPLRMPYGCLVSSP